jgi:hypothetical protein
VSAGTNVSCLSRTTAAEGQERCGVGGRLLASGCPGIRSAKMRSVPVGLQASECVLDSWLLRRGPASLQVSESALRDLLSGGVRRSDEAAGERVALRGLLSGEARWVLLLVVGRWGAM